MLQVGEWTIHESFDLLTRADEELHLTPKAMDVLMHLVRKKDQVVSKQELLDTFWRGAISSDNAVHKTMAELRRAFDDSSRTPHYIQTYPKRGYRLIASVMSEDPEAIAPPVKPTSTARPVIAVLPFLNMIESTGLTHFADGLSEDIANYLGRSGALAAISHTSSFRYRSINAGPREIGRRLMVSHLVEGSVRDQQGMVRVTVQLIDTTTGLQSWANRYDRQLEDHLGTQDELAASIVADVHRHFGVKMPRQPTVDRSYLKALA